MCFSFGSEVPHFTYSISTNGFSNVPQISRIRKYDIASAQKYKVAEHCQGSDYKEILNVIFWEFLVCLNGHINLLSFINGHARPFLTIIPFN